MWPRHTKRRVKLGLDLWLGPAPYPDALMDACELRGANTLKPTRQFPSHFAFIRTNPPNPEQRYEFDPDSRLRTCLQLSRLIQPTATAFEYAARIISGKGAKREIIPYAVRGIGANAFTVHDGANWFGDDHALALRKLLTIFAPDNLPDRVKKALWYHEYVAWTQMIDVRWPLCVTALEALIHTDDTDRPRGKRSGSTRQFVGRLLKLLHFVPELKWSEASLRAVYDRRSGLVHGVGRGADALSQEGKRLYMLAENGLRAVVLAAIRGTGVADIFRSKASIRASLGL